MGLGHTSTFAKLASFKTLASEESQLSSSPMAQTLRFPSLSISKFFLLISNRPSHSSPSHSIPFPSPHAPNPLLPLPPFLPLRTFSSNSNTNNPSSFDWSDNDDDTPATKFKPAAANTTKPLPPPYNPFNKKPLINEPNDPSNLQEIFHNMRAHGLTNHAVKMFDALSQQGLTHEALELFAVIKDKGAMPDVVAHTAVIEAYANAGGHSKEAVRAFDRMLASGVSPNVYTYGVLIKGLAKDCKLSEARKYLIEMMGKGMKPDASVYIAVFEGYVCGELIDDARILLEEMRGMGFRPDEKGVRENLGKRGQVFRSVMSLLFGK